MLVLTPYIRCNFSHRLGWLLRVVRLEWVYMRRAGVADLPLHGGRVPEWLAARMTRLGTAITEAVVLEFGVSGFLTRLSDPFWFQSFGAVMGMDWHSSGITTSVMGALKRGLQPRSHELGIHICGGRGRHSRNTPSELRTISERHGLNANELIKTSRLTARIDNNAIADGFQIYLHSFVLSERGEWAVVQQGLNNTSGMARRYHWHSESVKDFLSDPHSGIVGDNQGLIMNLVDHSACSTQKAMLKLSTTHQTDALAAHRHLRMPRHHEVRPSVVDAKRLGAALALAHDRELKSFADLLLLESVGPRTLQSLALIAEVIYGVPSRFSDPARFSFALGGKDGHPFPVPLKTYDESIAVLRKSLESAKLGVSDKLDGFRRLDRFTRLIEQQLDPKANFDAVVQHERKISDSLDGRSVRIKRTYASPRQGSLF